MMVEYIEREAFLASMRNLYCKDCVRRKGKKNGKLKTLYEIGEAPCRACGIDDVLSDVEDFSASDVKPVKWIPVTERLPEENKSVLVCFDFKGRKSIDVAELWSDGRFHNYSDDYLTPEGRKYRRATHWMPLPEPPKDGET